MTLELNKLQSYDPDFSPKECTNRACVSPVWVSPDPRLFSSIRAQRLVLDAPPLNGKVRIENIDDDRYVYNIPVSYPSIQSITNGQIKYYVSIHLLYELIPCKVF